MSDKRPWIYGALGAAVATAATVVAVTVMADPEPTAGGTDPATTPSAEPTTSDSADEPGPSPSDPAQSDDPGSEQAVPVY